MTFMKMQPSFNAQVRAEADEKTDTEKAVAAHTRCVAQPAVRSGAGGTFYGKGKGAACYPVRRCAEEVARENKVCGRANLRPRQHMAAGAAT